MPIRSGKKNASPAELCIRAACLLALTMGSALAAGESAPSASSGSSFATTGADPFAIGEKVAFAGLSVGTFGTYGSSLIPPVSAGFDYAFHEYMTLGGFFAFSRYDLYSADLTYLTFAARGTFHPTFWFKKLKIPLDPYGIATVGYTNASWSGTGSNTYSYVVIGPSVGVRYWFLPNLAGQAEAGLGYGVSLASIGLALKI